MFIFCQINCLLNGEEKKFYKNFYPAMFRVLFILLFENDLGRKSGFVEDWLSP